jgi:glutamate synthase (NADPH/NADH) large chain
LGETGRNFAAGMSGGIAYVYNLANDFASLCNQEMVDLDPIEPSDADVLQSMLSSHFEKTGSAVAKFVLADLENQMKYFIKVFPRDYKKVLSKKNGITINQ